MRAETEAAVRAASVAQRIADSREGAGHLTSKGGIDLVTAADVACEDAIRAELGREFAHAVVGEERGGTVPDGAPYWLVDPICGTRPYASRVPLYCSNVALVEHGHVVVAAVALGMSGEVAYAERGGGAWIRSAAGERRALPNADNHTVWISGKSVHAANVYRDALLRRRLYVWSFSSSIAYPYLADGRIAGIVHFGTTAPEHTAAGCLIAAESGAVVTDLLGHPWSLSTHALILAATPALHADLRDLVEQARS